VSKSRIWRALGGAILCAAGTLLIGLAASPAAETPVSRTALTAEEEARTRADEAAQRLVATLMTELGAALEKGGPPEALRVCSEVAQAVTADMGGGSGVRVRRTGLRLRNPANQPDPFERAWLEQAQSVVAQGGVPAAVYEVLPAEGGGRELRHLRPILFPGGVCAQCHGTTEEISPEVKSLLRQRYPDDRAVDFRPGDLRGAVSVRVLLAEP
jgi:hypothetical protein